MNTEKKTFTPAEVEVIRFEKNDVITTSGCDEHGPTGSTGTIWEEEDEDE